MSQPTASPNHRNRHYMAAVVLGTALSALGVPQALAKEHADLNPKVVADISRYCTACWRNARLPTDSWGDCTQDVFSRLMQRLKLTQWNRVFQAETAERQEFVRAIDAVKKRTQRRLKRTKPMPEILADQSDVDHRKRAEELEIVHQAADEVLSERQKTILRLSMEGWCVAEMAQELDLAPERVSDEKYKAVRKLRQHLKVA
ncbi:MAG: sigma-70 family RNA polymerase sigma factor [Gemmataceae bacterium]